MGKNQKLIFFIPDADLTSTCIIFLLVNVFFRPAWPPVQLINKL